MLKPAAFMKALLADNKVLQGLSRKGALSDTSVIFRMWIL